MQKKITDFEHPTYKDKRMQQGNIKLRLSCIYFIK